MEMAREVAELVDGLRAKSLVMQDLMDRQKQQEKGVYLLLLSASLDLDAAIAHLNELMVVLGQQDER